MIKPTVKRRNIIKPTGISIKIYEKIKSYCKHLLEIQIVSPILAVHGARKICHGARKICPRLGSEGRHGKEGDLSGVAQGKRSMGKLYDRKRQITLKTRGSQHRCQMSCEETMNLHVNVTFITKQTSDSART